MTTQCQVTRSSTRCEKRNWLKGVVVGIVAALCAGLPVVFETARAQEKKLTIEELLSRHLEALGSAESRSRAASRVVSGKSNLLIRLGGAANLDGTAMIVSTGPKFRFGIQFSTQDYTGEDIAFDGTRAATGLLPQGRRSGLSTFLNSQSLPIREGLMCGVLTTAWPLLRAGQLQPKLDYRGVKKFLDRQLHEVSYRAAKGGGEVKTVLYFDPTTFRHVASKYSFEIGAGIGSREASNENPESYYSVTEMFDDFRVVDGLTLPHKYRMQYSAESRSSSSLYDWTIVIAEIKHNQSLDNQLFVIR